MSCSGCNQEVFIQNKKHNLCSECVFKKSHNGKSKSEIYQERANEKERKIYILKHKNISQKIEKSKWAQSLYKGYVQDEISKQNEILQNLAELEARREAKDNGEEFDLETFEINLGIVKDLPNSKLLKTKKQKPIKQVSSKQAPIERAYKLTCIDMDHTTEPICTGCGKYQGGDIKLSHSHLISRADCQRIGKPELIFDRDNLTYHCIDFGMNKGCHGKWENPTQRHILLDFEKNIQYISSIDNNLYLKYNSRVDIDLL